ncbi:MAG: hypothetical protein JWP52_2616 [Rhizobacter sp.]|nr:hypothetical protein [Rhizobacter sp.]
MKIDTEIRRITKPGANLFLALGFSPKKRSACRPFRAVTLVVG